MVTSLNRSSEEDSGSRPPPDPIAEALEAISSPRFGVDVAASTTARSRSRPPAVYTSGLFAEAPAPPPSALSAPAGVPTRSTGGVTGGVTPKGHLTGKNALFRYGPAKEGTICAGFVGSGRQRFCHKVRIEGLNHCGTVLHGRDKFELEPNSYYIPLRGETAMTYPFLRLGDLELHGKVNLVTGGHSTEEWRDIMEAFIEEHNILLDEDDISDPEGDLPPAAPVPKSVRESEGDAMSALGGGSLSSYSDPFAAGGSKRSTKSVLSIPWSIEKVTSRASWNGFRPSLGPHWTSGELPDEKWSPYLDETRSAVRVVANSIEAVIHQLPVSFDQLRAHMEDKTVSYQTYCDDTVTPLQRLTERVNGLLEAALGDGTGASESWWVENKSLLNAIQVLSGRLAFLGNKVNISDFDSEILALKKSVAEGMKATVRRVVEAVDAFEERLAPLESSMAAGAPGIPTSPSASQANNVNPDLYKSLMEQVRLLESMHLDLQREVDRVKTAANTAGIRVGELGFDSLEQLIDQLETDGVSATAYATHVDVASIFCHFADGNAQADTNTAELKAMRAANINDPICCIYTASFRQNLPPYLLDGGGPVKMGSTFPLLKNRDAWEGPAGIDGGRALLKKAVRDAYGMTKVYIQSNLRAGTTVRELADFCNSQSYEWWINLCTHIDDEILALSKFGISEAKVFELVSDELQIMFRQIYEERMKMEVFSDNRDPIRYYAKCIWTTMHAHKVMTEFSEVGFASHVLISSLFTRFLAKQTGENMGAGVMAHVTRLDGEIKKANAKIESKALGLTGRIDQLTTRMKNVEAACGKKATP